MIASGSVRTAVTALGLMALLLLSSAAQVLAARLPMVDFERNIARVLDKGKGEDTDVAKGYWEKVARDGEILLAANPSSTNYLLGTARAYFGLGDYQRAAELYEGLLSANAQLGVKDLAGQFPWTYVYLGLSYAKLGQTMKAVEAWRQVPKAVGLIYTLIVHDLPQLKDTSSAQDFDHTAKHIQRALIAARAVAWICGQPSFGQLGGVQVGAYSDCGGHGGQSGASNPGPGGGGGSEN
ncbi:MAG: tetratricopeptide repeat protein [Proteobacteria bacterium]|nr:tetratricopeptide repeat protein [Pseudomonadota bacterium]MBU1595336.1 tetratricopeptide repeat protein [Pseudomonadota bacterium]